jgi:hypothetical protein
VCLAKDNGKKAQQKCHRKKHLGLCECPICRSHREASDGPGDEAEDDRTKRNVAHVDYRQTKMKKSTDNFFVGKGKLCADANTDNRNKAQWTSDNRRKRAEQPQSGGKAGKQRKTQTEKDTDEDTSNNGGRWKLLYSDKETPSPM